MDDLRMWAKPPVKIPSRFSGLRARRGARLAAFAGLAVAASLSLSACANSNSFGLAKQACNHVETSIRLYKDATSDTNQALAQKQANSALMQLRKALPLAAQAASDSGQWQALMTTLSESSRVSESHLVHALKLQCDVAYNPLPLISPGPGANQPSNISPASAKKVPYTPNTVPYPTSG